MSHQALSRPDFWLPQRRLADDPAPIVRPWNPQAVVLVLASGFFLSAGCEKQPPSAEVSREFWRWFSEHSADYARVFSHQEPTAGPMSDARQREAERAATDTVSRLRAINHDFAPFFGYSAGLSQLIITTGGKKQSFTAAEQFVASAPPIAGWRFVALKPPRRFDPNTEIQSGVATLRMGDLRYTRQPKGDGAFAFTIFVRAKVAETPGAYRKLCTQLLEDSLGERLAAQAVRGVEVRELPDPPPTPTSSFVEIYRDISSETP